MTWVGLASRLFTSPLPRRSRRLSAAGQFMLGSPVTQVTAARAVPPLAVASPGSARHGPDAAFTSVTPPPAAPAATAAPHQQPWQQQRAGGTGGDTVRQLPSSSCTVPSDCTTQSCGAGAAGCCGQSLHRLPVPLLRRHPGTCRDGWPWAATSWAWLPRARLGGHRQPPRLCWPGRSGTVPIPGLTKRLFGLYQPLLELLPRHPWAHLVADSCRHLPWIPDRVVLRQRPASPACWVLHGAMSTTVPFG